MGNLTAPFLGIDPLPARRARPRPETHEEPRLSGARDEPRSAPAEPTRDAEMLDIVHRFETVYAELAPPVEPEIQRDSALGHDFLVEFTHDLAHERAPRTERDDNIDIEEAFSILRAAEGNGKAVAERWERGSARAIDAEERALPHALEDVISLPPTRSALKLPESEKASTAPRGEWSAISRTMWSSVVIAAAVALAIGTAVGYVMGRNPDTVASASKVQVTEQGAPQLRFDYELRNR